MRYVYAMTWRERRKLRKIARRITIQSREHQNNITEYFRVMMEAARQEFCEDDRPTLEAFLRECLEASFKSNK